MSARQTVRLSRERHRRLVGRAEEKRLFWEAVSSGEPPFGVLYVFGVGGSGKTALLREFAYLCEEAGIPTGYLDAHGLDSPPLSFLLRNPRPGCRVAMIDGCEHLRPLEGWVDEALIRRLPEGLLLVLAGRDPPPAEWRTDPGWRSLVYLMPLGDLDGKESREYLCQRGLDPRRHQSVLEFAHGHPLALCLAADALVRRPHSPFRPAEEPGITRLLVECFVRKAPAPVHRTALETCALARHTTESLLSHTLPDGEDADDCFGWLRSLDFIGSGPLGLFPHPTARESLTADLRWRNPDRYSALLRRIRGYYAAHLGSAREEERQRALPDYLFLHRDDAVLRPLLGRGELEGTEIASPHPDELPVLRAMVEQHEGKASAGLAEFWLTRDRARTLVYRDASGRPAGFVTTIALAEEAAEGTEADPAARAVRHYLQRQAPLRLGEAAGLIRFWMAHQAYQGGPEMRDLLLAGILRHALAEPPACTFLIASERGPSRARMLARLGFARLPEGGFGIEGRDYGVYGHDWRVESPDSWLRSLAEHGPAEGIPSGIPPTDSGVLLLREEDFASSVREALRNNCRPEALRSSPLLRSRVVIRRVGGGAGHRERIAVLRCLLLEAAEELRQTPREAKLYRALHHTYFQPAATQEQAALLLGLPFSTYRRHLKTGTERVTGILWRKEIDGP